MMSIDRVSMVISADESKLHIRSSTRSAKSAILPHPLASQVQFDDEEDILFYFHLQRPAAADLRGSGELVRSG